MQNRLIKRNIVRTKRAMRVRKRVQGTVTRPRMCVVKSNKHIEVQLIDDESGKTLLGYSTRGSKAKGSEFGSKSKVAAKKLGEMVAEGAKKMGIELVSFDRGHHKYHGILKELADSARAAGIQF